MTEQTPTSTQTPAPSLDILAEMKQAWQVFTLKEPAMRTVAKKEEATLIGAVILCAPPIIKIIIAFLVLRGFASPHFASIFINFIASVIALFAPFYIARGFFNGKGDVEEFFRILTYARLPQVGTVIFMILPIFFGLGLVLDFLVDLWLLWVTHIVLTKIMGLEEMDSFKVVGITFIGYILLVGIFTLIF